MDLIEKLGGYKEAKKQCELMHDLDIFKQDGDVYAKSYIEDVLLEYRREHKIYAVGDSVLFKDAWLWSTVFVIKEVITDANFETAYLVSERIAPTAEKIRHATEEEIKAGYRL